MSDWHECSEAERKLIESCGPSETCVLFGEHGVHKLSVARWQSIFGDAIRDALKMALSKAGVEHSFEQTEPGGWRLKTNSEVTVLYADKDRESFWDQDLLASTVTVRVRGPDGREGTGTAELIPPGRAH